MRPALPLITDVLALRSFVRRKLPYSDRTQAKWGGRAIGRKGTEYEGEDDSGTKTN
jgi:hypothetical protein